LGPSGQRARLAGAEQSLRGARLAGAEQSLRDARLAGAKQSLRGARLAGAKQSLKGAGRCACLAGAKQARSRETATGEPSHEKGALWSGRLRGACGHLCVWRT